MIYVLIFGALALACVLGWQFAAKPLIDAPERGASQEHDAHAHVMRLKYGNTWPAQVIRARLITVNTLLQAAEPVTLHAARARQYPLTSPVRPDALTPPCEAEPRPGDEAAAGEPLALVTRPPLPPDWDAVFAANAEAAAKARAETDAAYEFMLSYYMPLGGA